MKSSIIAGGCLLAGLLFATVSFAAEDGLVGWWRFDEGVGKTAIDSVTQKKEAIQGNFRYVQGVCGTAVKFDGFTSRIVCKAADAPRFEDGFSIEAWVAPQAYPWNWCGIVDRHTSESEGYFFGVDAEGRVGLHLNAGGHWRACTSQVKIPFMQWSHIAGTFSENDGISVYVNGQAVGRLAVKGKLATDEELDLLIGRNHTRLAPTAPVRPSNTFPTSYSFDGIIDELKIYNRALSTEEIERDYNQNKPHTPPAVEWRKLPQLAKGVSRFGAAYCRLKFYEEWDALWRVADHPDVVVSFDDGPYKMVFWRGTNYNMNLVTENGRWVGDQSAETGAAAGCAEHMSDKHCRYAHVRVIENHDARVVVHWRYALCDVKYQIACVDEKTGWGAWADEYYYIYPDGAAIRHFTVRGTRGCSITEPTVLNQPGEKAEDNIELKAVTVANMAGQSRDYTWDPWPGTSKGRVAFAEPVPNANICVVNLKSTYKPFYIYEPRSRISPYGGGLAELRTDYSRFPTWNHWPVSQAPSDGRYALAPDRVSSSAITSPRSRKRRTATGEEGNFIMGLGNKSVSELLMLARSWINPPILTIKNAGFGCGEYRKNERAYFLSKELASEGKELVFELACSEKRPAFNPAFVVEDWGQANAALTINGREVKRGKNFRFGHRHRLEGSDLIVWVKNESTEPVKICLSPTAK